MWALPLKGAQTRRIAALETVAVHRRGATKLVGLRRVSASHGGNAAFCSRRPMRRPRKFNSAAPFCAIGTNQVLRL